MQDQNLVTVALDGTGGDNVDARSVASAVRFALVLNPSLRVLVYGGQKLKQALSQEKIDAKRYDFFQRQNVSLKMKTLARF